MNGINCSVHFLTLKQIGYEELNPAVTFYHDRTHFGAQRNVYAQFAEDFNLQQGRKFVLHNRLATTPNKMSRLKDQVREFDELLSNKKQTTIESSKIKDNNDANKPLGKSHRSSFSSNEIISNYFLSGLNTYVNKLIWLAQNRLLIIMQDGSLVWLIIDTNSGDLIKILIDKSLTETFGASSSKLSGNCICDSALIVKSSRQSPVLIFVYSDKSKVDLITFGKQSQFNEYLKNPKDTQTLEKLSSFEPSLVISYEFSCPDIYMIEKRISTQSNSSYLNDESLNTSTFSVWWVNDGQANWQPGTSTQVISLLERDDLRNNVLVLSTSLADLNLLEYLFKSDGQLLSLHYTSKNSLISIEQIETNAQKYLINVYKYDLNECDEKSNNNNKPKSPKIKLTSFGLDSKISTVEQIKTCSKFILMLSVDQSLVLYDIKRNIINKFNLSSINLTNEIDQQFKLFNSIEWLLDDLIFCVFNLNGQMRLFDVAFNHIELNYMTRYLIKFKSISEYLNENLFVPFEITSSSLVNNRFVRLVSSRSIFTDTLWSCFHYSKGPFGLFRLALPNNFNCISLVNHYIKNSQYLDQQDLSAIQQNNKAQTENTNIDKDYDYPFVSKYLTKAVNLLLTLNWDEEPHLCLACLYRILNFLLSGQVVINLQTELLIEEALGSFYKPKRQLSEKTIYEYKHQISRYARRFFYVILKNKSLNKAFLLAVDIGAKDLFNDLYYCALDLHENQLAEVCRKKYHEILKEENMEKVRNELNRSVTTIDDNIKGNYTEIDKYSVSSSENTSADSDNESYSSLNDYEFFNDGHRVLTQNLRLNQDNFRKNVEKQRVKLSPPVFYAEDEIENFAKNILSRNKFVYQFKLDE